MTFQNTLIKIGRPIPKPIYNIYNPLGLKLLTRLRLDLSHLNQHKFNHNFQHCLNRLRSCSLQFESVSHFFLHCHYYSNIRSTLLNELQSIDTQLLNQEDDIVLFYESTKCNTNQDFRLLNVGSLNTFLQQHNKGSPNWLTKSHYFINIHHCFHSKENGHCTIFHYVWSDKFFVAFTDPHCCISRLIKAFFWLLLS